MNEWLGIATIFLAATGAAFLVFALLRRAAAKPPNPNDDQEPEEARADWEPDLAARMAPDPKAASDLQQSLWGAPAR